MPFQTALPWISRVALAAFVWFFSTVCSQMLPQIVCISWNIITHITWLRVETVSLQNVALWYSMWSLKTSSQIYQIQLKWFSLVWRGTLKLLTKSQLLHWFGIHTTFSLLCWPRQACVWFFKIDPLSTYFTRIPPPPQTGICSLGCISGHRPLQSLQTVPKEACHKRLPS